MKNPKKVNRIARIVASAIVAFTFACPAWAQEGVHTPMPAPSSVPAMNPGTVGNSIRSDQADNPSAPAAQSAPSDDSDSINVTGGVPGSPPSSEAAPAETSAPPVTSAPAEAGEVPSPPAAPAEVSAPAPAAPAEAIAPPAASAPAEATAPAPAAPSAPAEASAPAPAAPSAPAEVSAPASTAHAEASAPAAAPSAVSATLPEAPVTVSEPAPAALPSVAPAPPAAVSVSTPVTTAAMPPSGALAPPMVLAPVPAEVAPEPGPKPPETPAEAGGTPPPAQSRQSAGKTGEAKGTKVASNEPQQTNPTGLQFGNNKGPIHIKSESMSLDYQNHSVLWTGHVHATQDQAQLTSDKLRVNYFDKDFKQLKDMIADGNVRISQGTQWATGEHGVMDQTKRTMVLTGSPVVHDCANQITGKRITVFLDTNKSVVEDARAIIFPHNSQGDEPPQTGCQ